MRENDQRLQKRLDHIDHAYMRKVERRGRKNLTGLSLGVIAVSLFTGYWGDVHQNQEAEANSSVSITVIGEALDPANSDMAIVFFNGFNTTNAVQLARDMGPVVQQLTDGQTWSVNNGNATLNPKENASAIVNEARIHNIHKITVVAYSEGSINALEAVPFIMENPAGPQVQAIVSISGAYGYDELRPSQQAELNLAETLKPIPGIEHSSVARFLSEEYLQRKHGNFFSNGVEILQAMQDKRMTSTALLASQIFSIVDANLSDDFKRIAAAGANNQLPSFYYLGTGNPGYDYVIDDKLAAARYAEDAKAAGIDFVDRYVPGAVHTRTDIAHDEYMQTMQAISIDNAAKIVAAHSFYKFMNHRIATKVANKW